MQRISQSTLDTISSNPAFGRYANPAMSRRMSHDLVRSSQNDSSQKNESSKSRYSTDDLLPLLQNVPGLALAGGGGALRRDIETDGRPTAECSPLHQPSQLHQPPSVSRMASSLSSRSSGDDLINLIISDEKYHILVVDDSPLNRKMLSKLLKSKGHVIEEAADGQQGVDKVKQEADAGRNYDVILMDFVMPVMDGPTATRAIRAMDVKSPIFGLTGNLRISVIAVARAKGCFSNLGGFSSVFIVTIL